MSVSFSNRPPAPVGARRTIATYATYAEAERAVDRLSDAGFPVARVAIVGSGLRYVEQIAGRVTTTRAGVAGAAQGALLGILFAALFGLFFTLDGGSFVGVLLYGLLTGGLFGALIAALLHAARGGRRDFASVAGTQAERYEIQVDAPVADEAERLLGAAARTSTR